MSKVGEELILGMKNAVAHARGTKRAARETTIAIPAKVDVVAIRRKLHLTQEDFALRFGFSVKNIRNWEQGIRKPDGAARAYLLVIARKPKAVQEALSAA